MKTKKDKPVIFGVPCTHCHTPNQVPGMKCLECGKYIWTKTQIIVAWAVSVISIIIMSGYVSTLKGGKEILGVIFAIAFVLVLRKMKLRIK